MKNFVYTNPNPLGVGRDDCVIRSFSILLDKSWDEVFKEMSDIAFKHKTVVTRDLAIEFYLIENGYELHHVNGRYTVNNLKVDEKTLILVEGHATVVDKCNIYDTADCGRKIVQKFSVKIDIGGN